MQSARFNLVFFAAVLSLWVITVSGAPAVQAAHAGDEQPAGDRATDAGAGEEQADERKTATSQQAVILRVNRHTEVQGYVEFEDEETLVLRTHPAGRTETYTKSRIGEIIRIVEPEPGQRGVVYMRDGQVREGVIVEDGFDRVVVEIEGVRARIQRRFVDRVILKPTFEQLYREFKDGLGPRMTERHLLLCQWLVENRKYELAKQELTELIGSAEQDVPEAQRLLRLVEAQLSLRQSAEADGPSGGEEEPEAEVDRGRLLTREEVNLMRVYEIDFSSPPRLAVKPETIRKMIEQYGSSGVIPTSATERNALFRADPLEIVRMLFELRARELYGEVQVLSEPPAMNLFRQRVHNTWLLQNCATSGCHGGPDAGALMLHRRGYQNERVRYTNFLILERLDLDPDWPLINYEDPEMSLIVQYALPQDAARKPHPDVRGWRPAFTRPDDRMKRDTIQWIKSMMRPRPGYPIDFDPPRPDEPDKPEKKEPEAENGGHVPR